MTRDNIKNFKDLPFDEMHDGVGAVLEFNNGYGVSVVRHQYSYGGDVGLYELAVLLDGSLCYNTYITDDVEGHLSESDVSELMVQVQALKPNLQKEVKLT